MYTERFYRSWTAGNGLESFRVVSGESDLQIYAEKCLRKRHGLLEDIRARLRDHISRHPVFLRSMVPVETGTRDFPQVHGGIGKTLEHRTHGLGCRGNSQ